MRASVHVSARLALVPALVGALILATLMIGPAAEAQRIRPDFFGMHDYDWSRSPTPPVVGAANFTTSGTYWINIEREKKQYDWNRLDDQAAAAEALGAQPMIVLGRTPNFYSEQSGTAHYDDYMPPKRAWKRWVRKVVGRYGDRLDYQIWPEPNIIENWKGSQRQMAKLTALAGRIIHKKARRAEVVAPAMTLRLESQRQWMKGYFKKSVGGKRVHKYVDVVAIDTFPHQSGEPEDSYRLMKEAKRILRRIGVRRPFWNNEINYGVAGGGEPTDTEYSEDEQQSFVIRTYVLSAAAGMKRTYWLGWFDTDTMAVSMTTGNDPVTAQQAAPGTSYLVVRGWLNRTRFKGCDRKRGGLWKCTARKGRRQVRHIYWDTKGDTRIRTPRRTRRIEDQDGNVQRTRGRTRLTVDYRPVMALSRK